METGGTIEAIELLSNNLLAVVRIWYQHGSIASAWLICIFPLVYMLKRLTVVAKAKDVWADFT